MGKSRRFVPRRLMVMLCGTVLGIVSPLRAQTDQKLEQVLSELDKAQQNLQAVQADVSRVQYDSVLQEKEAPQTGKIYFRHKGNELQMALDVNDQGYERIVLWSGGKLQLFEPRQNRVNVYNAQNKQDEVESFLVLGFGGGGHAMQKAYDITYQGTEKIDGVEAAKLDLTPKNQKVKNMFPHILLWIDPNRGVPVQQQLFQGDGNYLLNTFSNIQPGKVPDSAFKLKTNSKTTFEGGSGGDDSAK